MKFQILHENAGRMRIGALPARMTLRDAEKGCRKGEQTALIALIPEPFPVDP